MKNILLVKGDKQQLAVGKFVERVQANDTKSSGKFQNVTTKVSTSSEMFSGWTSKKSRVGVNLLDFIYNVKLADATACPGSAPLPLQGEVQE